MISPEYKEVIKEFLGNHYSPKIISFLSKKKVFNTDGNCFSTDSIQKIVNGSQPNPKVELLIIKLVNKAKAEKELLEQLQQ